MTKKQRQVILEEIAYLNDEELAKECLEKVEWAESEKSYEKCLREVADLYIEIAKERGIDIFK